MLFNFEQFLQAHLLGFHLTEVYPGAEGKLGKDSQWGSGGMCSPPTPLLRDDISRGAFPGSWTRESVQ